MGHHHGMCMPYQLQQKAQFHSNMPISDTLGFVGLGQEICFLKHYIYLSSLKIMFEKLGSFYQSRW